MSKTVLRMLACLKSLWRSEIALSAQLIDRWRDCLALFREKPFIPDVFAIDLGLPKVDGLTVLQAVKADPNCERIPTLVFAQPGTPNFLKAVELRADVCVAKPMALEDYAHLQNGSRAVEC